MLRVHALHTGDVRIDTALAHRTRVPLHPLPAQLEALGHRLSDLTHVVMTHLHSDHASGLAYLRGLDVPVVLGPGEWREANRNPAYIEHQFRLPLAYRDAEYRTVRGVPGFDAAHDLLGDGRILFLATPGHTRGHQSILARGERDVLLTADIAYDRDALAREILPASLSAPKAAARSLTAVRRFVEAEPDAIVQFGHDPATFGATRRALRTVGTSREHARAA